VCLEGEADTLFHSFLRPYRPIAKELKRTLPIGGYTQTFAEMPQAKKGELTHPLEVSGKLWPVGTILMNVKWEGEKQWCGNLPDGNRIETIPSEGFMVLDDADFCEVRSRSQG
jgi:hypothetical protein